MCFVLHNWCKERKFWNVTYFTLAYMSICMYIYTPSPAYVAHEVLSYEISKWSKISYSYIVNAAYAWSGLRRELLLPASCCKEMTVWNGMGAYISTASSRTCQEDCMCPSSSLCKQFLRESENRQQQKGWKKAETASPSWFRTNDVKQQKKARAEGTDKERN